jgi:multidrug efflux pump subunit AcrA (membrane-fusion protein)
LPFEASNARKNRSFVPPAKRTPPAVVSTGPHSWLAVEARQAAALAAAQAAEVAARETALKAEQAARDAEFAEQTAREAALEAAAAVNAPRPRYIP